MSRPLLVVEPGENYPRLWARKQPWMRMDPELEGVWSVTCFVVRKGWRKSGLMYELANATVEYGGQAGARVLEGYPTEPPAGRTVIWDEASVGLVQVFLGAGYELVASPTLRPRVVPRGIRWSASPLAAGLDVASVFTLAADACAFCLALLGRALPRAVEERHGAIPGG